MVRPRSRPEPTIRAFALYICAHAVPDAFAKNLRTPKILKPPKAVKGLKAPKAVKSLKAPKAVKARERRTRQWTFRPRPRRDPKLRPPRRSGFPIRCAAEWGMSTPGAAYCARPWSNWTRFRSATPGAVPSTPAGRINSTWDTSP